MMLSSRAELEEERRLFYVAITRAKKRLFLSYALTRYRFGRLKNCEPSRFLDDVDKSFVKVSAKYMGADSVPSSNAGFAKSFVSGIKKTISSKPVPKATAYKPTTDFAPSDTTGLKEGMKVEHPKFGFGKVVKMDETAQTVKPGSILSILGRRPYCLVLLNLGSMRIESLFDYPGSYN